jgi:hypothetical protein
MTSPALPEIVKQRQWSDEELCAAGFAPYERKKQLVMARVLPAAEAPLTIIWPLETIVVEAGYILCYDPAEGIRPALAEYDLWPVRPDMFALSYKVWDEPTWSPSPAEDHLMRLGCNPYFKAQKIWARRLPTSMYVQSVESPVPVLVSAGNWLAIGVLGEPWYIEDSTFQHRYTVGP